MPRTCLPRKAPVGVRFAQAGAAQAGGPFPEGEGDTPIVSSKTEFAVSAEDPMVGGVASGVKEAFVFIGAQPVSLIEGKPQLPETLPDGEVTLSFYSKDQVGNVEQARHLSRHP